MLPRSHETKYQRETDAHSDVGRWDLPKNPTPSSMGLDRKPTAEHYNIIQWTHEIAHRCLEIPSASIQMEGDKAGRKSNFLFHTSWQQTTSKARSNYPSDTWNRKEKVGKSHFPVRERGVEIPSASIRTEEEETCRKIQLRLPHVLKRKNNFSVPSINQTHEFAKKWRKKSFHLAGPRPWNTIGEHSNGGRQGWSKNPTSSSLGLVVIKKGQCHPFVHQKHAIEKKCRKKSLLPSIPTIQKSRMVHLHVWGRDLPKNPSPSCPSRVQQ